MAPWANVETPNGVEALLAATTLRTASRTSLSETACNEPSLVDAEAGRWSASCRADPASVAQRLTGAADSSIFATGKDRATSVSSG